jgi:hypothetical protein
VIYLYIFGQENYHGNKDWTRYALEESLKAATDLSEWVKDAKAKGMKVKDISEVLLKAGWKKEIIEILI